MINQPVWGSDPPGERFISTARLWALCLVVLVCAAFVSACGGGSAVNGIPDYSDPNTDVPVPSDGHSNVRQKTIEGVLHYCDEQDVCVSAEAYALQPQYFCLRDGICLEGSDVDVGYRLLSEIPYYCDETSYCLPAKEYADCNSYLECIGNVDRDGYRQYVLKNPLESERRQTLAVEPTV